MADTYDIFAGSYVDAFYSEKTDNTSIEGTDFKPIPEVGGFPEAGMERDVIVAANYSHKYNRKLVGRANVPDIDMPVNYIPGSVHDNLIKLCEDGTRFQVKFIYWTDGTKKVGLAKVFNVFLASAGITGGEADVVQRTFTFAVDGGPVAEAVVTAKP
jgi:hypothetical protein